MLVTFSTVEMSRETSEETAIRYLNHELLPQLKQALGFVRGTWFGNGNKGNGAVVFETEEPAKGGLQAIGFELGGVKVTSSEVYRLHAES